MLYVAGEKMMERARIIDYIERLINGEVDDYILEYDSDANAVESALEKVVARLVNTLKKFRAGDAGLSDYVSALRSFMLSFQTELRVDDHGILDNNHLGIHLIHQYRSTTQLMRFLIMSDIRVSWRMLL